MRTFIAIPLPTECIILLEQIQQDLRRHNAEVRWVAIPSIHLTLKFLGEVPAERMPRLAEALASGAIFTAPFELSLERLGCFPNVKNPRIVWCGVDGETDELARLQKQVDADCEGMGFPPENRQFKPHLTLGRVNGRWNLQPLLNHIKMGTDLRCVFRVDHFNVYRSVLKPQGAEYTVLHTIALNEQD
jgi:2'-5' RNA ligase